MGVGFRSFVKRREQSLFCNICGVKDEILCSNKNSMLEAIKQLTSNIPKEAFKTFTSDRGKEFSCWKKVEEMGIDFYFADPYRSWQRGCNENSNGLLREF